VAASGIVLGAAYMLWLYQRTMFGKIENPKNERLPDLTLREFVTFAPLIALAFWIGLYPTPVIERLQFSVNKVVARVNPGALSPEALAECTTPGEATPLPPSLTAGPGGAPFITPPCADGTTQAPPAQPGGHQ
jgi:NADH-quinone oxidoreductase subunit M